MDDVTLSAELISLVKDDRLAEVFRLLDSGTAGADVTLLDGDGWSLLQHACVNSSTSPTLLCHLIR